MPQDIPLEASDTLAFSPPSLANLPTAPVFVLRAATSRDKRHYSRLFREEALQVHGIDDVRREVRAGLASLWTPEQFDAHMPVIENYWSQGDDYALQRRDDADLVWDFDPAEEARIEALLVEVNRAWPPLRRISADNAEYGQMSSALAVAVVVKNWTGLDHPLERDRGYLSVDCACDLREKLWTLESDAGLEAGTAWQELSIACLLRFALDKEEAKNSESPSPSKPAPPLSSETSTLEKGGKSQAPASSSKTQEPA